MTEWIPVGGDFIAADIIRWKEGVFEKKGRFKGKAARIAERRVIAEVLSEEDKEGWVRLLVRGCETIWIKPGKLFVAQLEKNREIRRRRQSLTRDTTERLAWSDESARESVVKSRPKKRKQKMASVSTVRKPRKKTSKKPKIS